VQSFLARNRKVLVEAGYFVPVSGSGRAGFHELPWLIKKANLKLLWRNFSIETAEVVIGAQVREAKLVGAHTLIFSSEDLSLLHLAEWAQLFKLVERISQVEGVRISGSTITWSPRKINDSARSAYPTLVRLGLTKKYQEVKGFLREHFLSVQGKASKIGDVTSIEVQYRTIPYSVNGFLEKWSRVNLGGAVFSGLSGSLAKVNQRDPSWFTKKLLQDNLSRSIEFDENYLFEWWRYHDENSIDLQRNAVRILSEP
jgi:hypothetical protein